MKERRHSRSGARAVTAHSAEIRYDPDQLTLLAVWANLTVGCSMFIHPIRPRPRLILFAFLRVFRGHESALKLGRSALDVGCSSGAVPFVAFL